MIAGTETTENQEKQTKSPWKWLLKVFVRLFNRVSLHALLIFRATTAFFFYVTRFYQYWGKSDTIRQEIKHNETEINFIFEKVPIRSFSVLKLFTVMSWTRSDETHQLLLKHKCLVLCRCWWTSTWSPSVKLFLHPVFQFRPLRS